MHMITVFFFFQAEDGIRDYKVTGVQTCALPISEHDQLRAVARLHRLDGFGDEPVRALARGEAHAVRHVEEEPDVHPVPPARQRGRASVRKRMTTSALRRASAQRSPGLAGAWSRPAL